MSEAKTFGEIDAWIKSAIDLKATHLPKEWHYEFKHRKNVKWVPESTVQFKDGELRYQKAIIDELNDNYLKLNKDYEKLIGRLREQGNTTKRIEKFEADLKEVQESEEKLTIEKCNYANRIDSALKILNESPSEYCTDLAEKDRDYEKMFVELHDAYKKLLERLRVALETKP